MTKNEAVFSNDIQNKKITVTKEFDAPLEQVWKAWTDSNILDQWWAPRPYRAETGTMDFRAGGVWLYSMVGPEGVAAWCRVDYKTVDPLKSITSTSVFCDEAGNTNPALPAMHWKKEFRRTSNGTLVSIEIRFDREADMEAILKMGFQGGFTMGMNNLDEYLMGHQG